MSWIALDVGGANIKLADGAGYTKSVHFPLWKTPDRLAQQLRALLVEAPARDRLAVTMTGELADCFATKAEGVDAILDAVVQAAAGRHTRVYLTSGELVTPQDARGHPLLAAASNWHALAVFSQRYVKDQIGVLIDVGSTTCDIIPLVEGAPAIAGKTDTERLIHGELIYTGVRRTPVCAVVDAIPYRGQRCPMAREVFATTGDAYLLLNDLPERPSDTHTADGRPFTRESARGRLARSVCADRDTFDENDAVAAAEMIGRAQVDEVAGAVEQVLTRLSAPPQVVVVSGQGEFLARRALEAIHVAAKTVSLSEELGPDVSCCAPAHALAVLARKEGGP